MSIERTTKRVVVRYRKRHDRSVRVRKGKGENNTGGTREKPRANGDNTAVR